MTSLRTRLMRAAAIALMVLALGANVAAASEDGSELDSVPYDPGLPASAE
ncbi:MAG: hypothetical protein ABI466_08380 [Chloroflexota bacterium]